MIRNYENFEVAVINYPLMNPALHPANFYDYFGLDYTNLDKWRVPVYIHIPFCRKICKFCIYSRQLADEHSQIIQRYMDALLTEIRMYGSSPYVKSMRIGAVFIGGGTPTCLTEVQMAGLLNAIHEYLPLEKNVEITVECNIANTDSGMLSVLKSSGVTRISTGVQTFDDRYREMFGMSTRSNDLLKWMAVASELGFKELSADLLYGLPGQSVSEWENDLSKAVRLPVSHFSVYKLALFAYTRLYKEIEQHIAPPLPETGVTKRMFYAADSFFESQGYIMQTAQEYCREHRQSEFWNLTYDGYGDNLSFGAFSFGYINGYSYQNHVNVNQYIEKISQGSFPVKMVSGKITRLQAMERSAILGFRKGTVDQKIFQEEFGNTMWDLFKEPLAELMEDGLVEEKGTLFQLTRDGRFYQGNVSAKFMRSTFHGVSALKKKMAIGMHVIPEFLSTKKV